MSIPLISIETTELFDNDATIWPNDSMLLDVWADIGQLWLNDSSLSIDHQTDGGHRPTNLYLL